MNKKEFLKRTSLVFFIRIFGALSSLIVTIVISRNFSPNDAGIFFLLTTIIIIIGNISSLGYGNALLRFISGFKAINNDKSINSFLKEGLSKVFFFSSFACLLFLLIHKPLSELLYGSEDISVVFFTMGLSIPLTALIYVGSPVLQGLGRDLLAVLMDRILLHLLFLTLLTIIFFFKVNINLFNLSFIYFISSLVVFVICFLSINRLIKLSDGFGKESFVPLKKSASYIWTGLLMTTAALYSCQLILAVFVEPSDVASFIVAQRISFVIGFSVLAIQHIAAPRFSRLYKLKRFDQLKSLALFCSRICYLIAIPMCSILFIYSQESILLLFGEDYIYASSLLNVLLIGQFINIITGPVVFLLLMTGNEKDVRNADLISGPFIICSGIVLTFFFESMGAAVATSLTMILKNLICAYYAKKRLGYNIFNFVTY